MTTPHGHALSHVQICLASSQTTLDDKLYCLREWLSIKPSPRKQVAQFLQQQLVQHHVAFGRPLATCHVLGRLHSGKEHDLSEAVAYLEEEIVRGRDFADTLVAYYKRQTTAPVKETLQQFDAKLDRSDVDCLKVLVLPHATYMKRCWTRLLQADGPRMLVAALHEAYAKDRRLAYFVQAVLACIHWSRVSTKACTTPPQYTAEAWKQSMKDHTRSEPRTLPLVDLGQDERFTHTAFVKPEWLQATETRKRKVQWMGEDNEEPPKPKKVKKDSDLGRIQQALGLTTHPSHPCLDRLPLADMDWHRDDYPKAFWSALWRTVVWYHVYGPKPALRVEQLVYVPSLQAVRLEPESGLPLVGSEVQCDRIDLDALPDPLRHRLVLHRDDDDVLKTLKQWFDALQPLCATCKFAEHVRRRVQQLGRALAKE